MAVACIKNGGRFTLKSDFFKAGQVRKLSLILAVIRRLIPEKAGVRSTFFRHIMRLFCAPPPFSWAFCRFSGSDQRGGSMFPAGSPASVAGFGGMILAAGSGIERGASGNMKIVCIPL